MRQMGAVALALLVPLLVLSARGVETADEGGATFKAVAVVHPVGKSKVHGKITFTEKDGMVTLKGEIHGLTPGKHGFHIHEFGDSSSADGSAAGGHFNPTKKPHGSPDAEERHVGDLGNITADDSGKAVIDMTDKVLKLQGPMSIIGRSVIIHADPDDFSQPVGNAGARIGCGVVGMANPNPPVKK